MNIGFVGLGKLGLPCALAIDAVDEHSVKGYDPDERIQDYLNKSDIHDYIILVCVKFFATFMTTLINLPSG